MVTDVEFIGREEEEGSRVDRAVAVDGCVTLSSPPWLATSLEQWFITSSSSTSPPASAGPLLTSMRDISSCSAPGSSF